MTATDRQELLKTLAEMGNLYPSMRFGQLFEFASQLASEEGTRKSSEVEDEAVLQGCRRHLDQRAPDLPVEWNGSPTSLTPARRELLQAFQELCERHPDWRLGQILTNIAEWADVDTYDAEDEELLKAARSHLGQHVCADLWGPNSARASSVQLDPSMWRWSEWLDIQEVSGYRSCVVYQIRLLTDGKPWEIKRFLDVDPEGILSIGRSTSMERRRKQFISGEAYCCGHSEANLLYYLKAHSPLLKLVPEPLYQYRFVAVDSENEAVIGENTLIKLYIKQFGEPPPLNSAVPDRYGEKIAW